MRKRSKHESSDKKRKDRKRKRSRIESEDREPSGSVPLTIRISSASAIAPKENAKKKKQHSKHRSSKKRGSSTKEGADTDPAVAKGETGKMTPFDLTRSVPNEAKRRKKEIHQVASFSSHSNAGAKFRDDYCVQGEEYQETKKVTWTEQRLLKWGALLRERPFDETDDRMSGWLMKVLSVSDPKPGTGEGN